MVNARPQLRGGGPSRRTRLLRALSLDSLPVSAVGQAYFVLDVEALGIRQHFRGATWVYERWNLCTQGI